MERVKNFINDNAELFKQMFIQHKAIMFLIEPETGKIVFANQASAEFYGYTIDELQNMLISDINTLPLDEIKAERLRAVFEERSYFIFPHKLANGETRTVEVYSSPVMIKGKPLLYSIIHDISERRKMENKISMLLQEKDLILREAHHSVKNNMNAIQNILTIQSESSPDSMAASILRVAASRIKSMIVLYDKLHLSRNTLGLQIRDYFSDLVDEILNLFPNRDSVTVQKHIEDFTLEQHTLFIIGMIINELLTNIMKYAFTPGENGKIKFKVEKKDEHIIIEIRDNGRGLPASFDLMKPAGFGLQLVVMLCEQLGGTIRAMNDNGAVFMLKFPGS